MDRMWVCIAARDEAKTIAELVSELWRLGFNVAVCDDGSRDNTATLAAARGAVVDRHEESHGIAQAMMDAWELALYHGAGRIIQMDAGGSHRPADALRFEGATADMVVGSRFLPESAYTGRPWRAAMSRAASVVCSIKTGRWVSDWTSGFRAFTADAALYLLHHQNYVARMHGWQIEVLGKVVQAGMSFIEAPIHYTAGESSFDLSVAREAFDVWRGL